MQLGKIPELLSIFSRLIFRTLSTILDKSLGTPSLTNFCRIFLVNLSVRPLPPNSMLFIVMKSSLLVYNIVWGRGRGWGKGVPYCSDVIWYCLQNTLSTDFVLSDPGALENKFTDFYACFRFSDSMRSLYEA